MKKTITAINFEYIYSPIEHKRACYSLDGEHWFNHGDFCEIADKSAKGLPLKKDANTSYDKGSDIEETNTSVKSSGATLVNKVLGYDFESTKAMYFATCHSNNWDWVVVTTEEIIIYNMNRKEFEAFMDTFASFNERKYIRFKKDSLKMMNWFEERL